MFAKSSITITSAYRVSDLNIYLNFCIKLCWFFKWTK